MLIGNKVEVPDECGDFCPEYNNGLKDLQSSCARCPIFLCVKLEHDIEGIYTPVLSPEEFCPELAQRFVNWWGEAQLPELKDTEDK